jgi:hypothetical protein
MYTTIKNNLDEIEKKPQAGRAGQQQHISVTATLAKINLDLVEEMAKLRKTTLDLGTQNDKLTKITTLLSIVGTILAIIQVVPIIFSLLKL